jgi:hypothetical protein
MEVEQEVCVTVTCPYCGEEFEDEVYVCIEVEPDEYP